MRDLAKLKKEAQEVMEQRKAGLTVFFNKYNKEVTLYNKTIEELKVVHTWLLENQDKKNFFLSDNTLGKASKEEFQKRTKPIINILKCSHIRVSKGPRLELSYRKTIFFPNPTNFNTKQQKHFDINIEISKHLGINCYGDESITHVTKLSKLTLSQAEKLVKKIAEIDKKIKELKDKRSDLFYRESNILSEVFNVRSQSR